ncbi:hypothetical protein ABH917_000007 [Thermobifida halotolerans]|nr:ATP-binding protein [Thermobifida halotolerans]
MGRNKPRKPKKEKTKKPRSTAYRSHIDQRDARAERNVIGVQNHYYGAGSAGAAQARVGLPSPEAGFTGREAELAQVLDVLDPTQEAGVGVVVSAGMGGVGKTALALVAGHTALERGWVAGALFVDLHGYTTPVDGDRAVHALLQVLGVPDEKIPSDAQARAGMYRALPEQHAQQWGGPVLVVADNASAPEQVRPLVPGHQRHRLLVTSRHRLGSLTARHLSLDTLDAETAVRVLAGVLRISDPEDERAADAAGLTALARACGRLPLALRISAAQLVNAPDLGPGELAEQLADAADRLAYLEDGERSLRAVFDQSRSRLPQNQAELLALLGLAPGPDISTAAAAVLANTTEQEVLPRLRRLAAAHLLTHTRGRWAMHDLTRAYAASLTATRPASRYPRARRRLLDHYATQTLHADLRLRALPGKQAPDTFPTAEHAWAWLDAERAVLIDAAHTAHHTGHTRAAIGLPLTLTLSHYLDRRRLFTDLAALAQHTAHTTGEVRNEAAAWGNLGTALHEVRRFEPSRPTSRPAPCTSRPVIPTAKPQPGTTSGWRWAVWAGTARRWSGWTRRWRSSPVKATSTGRAGPATNWAWSTPAPATPVRPLPCWRKPSHSWPPPTTPTHTRKPSTPSSRPERPQNKPKKTGKRPRSRHRPLIALEGSRESPVSGFRRQGRLRCVHACGPVSAWSAQTRQQERESVPGVQGRFCGAAGLSSHTTSSSQVHALAGVPSDHRRAWPPHHPTGRPIRHHLRPGRLLTNKKKEGGGFGRPLLR